MYNHFGKVRQFLKKLNTYLSYDRVILLLGIYPRENAHKNLYTVLRVTTKNGKQPKLLINRQTDKSSVVYP